MTKFEYLTECLSYVSIPYIYGGEDPSYGLDCSGLAQILLAKVGLDPADDQTADELWKWCKRSNFPMVHPNGSELGDLVFFGNASRASHIGNIVAPHMMIEAAHGTSNCTTLEIAHALGAKIEVNPISRRKDCLGIYRPPIAWSV